MVYLRVLQQKITLTLTLKLKLKPLLKKRESLLNDIIRPVAKRNMTIKEKKNRMKKEEKKSKQQKKKLTKNSSRNATLHFLATL
jgi:hypothetical protein